jgi:thymidylate kinase
MVASPIGIVVRGVFDQLSKENATYCVVGRTESLPELPLSDVDIVFGPEDLARVNDLVESVCLRINGRVVQCLRHERAAFYYVIALRRDNHEYCYLALDCCSDYIRRGRFLLTAEDMLAGRHRARDKSGNDKGFVVASSHMEFIYYLLKKIDKQSLSDGQAAHLSNIFNQAPGQAEEQMRRFFGATYHEQLILAARSGNWGWVKENIASLQADLSRNVGRSRPMEWLGDIRRVVSRLLHPSGLHIALLGPDGSGKSTVGHRLVPHVEQMFRRVTECHLMPSSRQTWDRSGGGEAPHQLGARSWPVSVLKIILWYCLYSGRWITVIYPAKVKSTLLVFDRYYHDLLVDPKRYRYGGPMWLARLVGRVIPRPDLWIVLDAPPLVLQARKREVPFEETARQRDAYKMLATQFDNAVVLNAAQPLDKVVADASEAIVAHMAERMKKRLRRRT